MKYLLSLLSLAALGCVAFGAEPPAYVSPFSGTPRTVTQYIQQCDGLTFRLVAIEVPVIANYPESPVSCPCTAAANCGSANCPALGGSGACTCTAPVGVPQPMAGPGTTYTVVAVPRLTALPRPFVGLRSWVKSHRPHLFATFMAGGCR